MIKPYTRPNLFNETEAAQRTRLAKELEQENLNHVLRCGQNYLSTKLPNYEERLGIILSEEDLTYILIDWVAADKVKPEYRNSLIEMVVEMYLLRRNNANDTSTEA